MRTKEINLIYKVTQTSVIPPSHTELDRKERWIESIQKTVKSEWEYQLIKVKYAFHNPEVDDMLSFFNGTVVLYYAIQNEDMITGTPHSSVLKNYREKILDEMLGYDVRLAKLVQRKRASMTEFKEVQQLFTFINMVKEELFDPSGYEFPDSEEYWKLVEKHGHVEAKRISIELLQKSLKRKLQ